MSSVVNQIASNLKRLRSMREMTQKEVALSAEIPQGQYSRIENGKAEPKLTTLQKIADVFEVPLSELVRQDEGSIGEELDLPLLEKVRRLGELPSDEREALETVIDVALDQKRLRDNLTGLLQD